MSIIVSVKIHDGIVMAADSATTLFKPNGEAGQIYEHANKIVNLVKGLPIGVMTCGAGSVGNASIHTLLKDLRLCLSEGGDRVLDRKNYTLEGVANEVRKFFVERADTVDFRGFLLLRICGYGSAKALAETWEVLLDGDQRPNPVCIQNEDNMGPRWNGEAAAMDRLILGLPSSLYDGVVKEGFITENKVAEFSNRLVQYTLETLIHPAAPVQDAIDLARFMVETTKGFVRFSLNHVKTVGGPIEIAAITKHEGFRWVQRKHFYTAEFNPGVQ